MSGKGGSIVEVAQAYSSGATATPDPTLSDNVASLSTTVARK